MPNSLTQLVNLANHRKRTHLTLDNVNAAIPARVAQARAEGHSVDECAEALGVTRQGLYYLLKKFG